MRGIFKSLLNDRPYSLINIAGLVIGITCVITLILWVTSETSYDRFHKDFDRIYRVGLVMQTPNREINSGSVNAPAGPEFKQKFPAIEESVRFVDRKDFVVTETQSVKLNIFFTDKSFFRIFSFNVIQGSQASWEESPDGIVLTESAAGKIFSEDDPVGEVVKISGKLYSVKAIIKDPPVNSILQFDCLGPIEVIEKQAYVAWDGGLTCYTFIKLVKGSDPSALEKDILDYMDEVINGRFKPAGYAMLPYLQKMGSIHLDSKTEYDLGEKGSRMEVIMFSFAGLLILLIACFNFVNISTALAFRRAKEVSVRKIFGSGRKSIIIHFIAESAVAIIISMMLALLALRILLPYSSTLVNKPLKLSYIDPAGWFLILSLLFIFCTVFASFYSAFYLSSSNPLALLNTTFRGRSRQTSRNILVTFQYTISTALIFCSLVIYSQIHYIKSSEKGFDERNVLIIQLNPKTSSSITLIKNKFGTIPGVNGVTVSAGGIPGIGFTSNGYLPEGFDQPVMLSAVYCDEDYLKTLGIQLISGRDLRNIKADDRKVIVNEAVCSLTGWTDPIGKTISRNGISYEVIGEVRDFKTASLHKKTEPMFITNVNEWGRFQNVIVKFQPGQSSEILKMSEAIMKEIDPEYQFDYAFLDNLISEEYAADRRLNYLLVIFAAIAVFISSLGLFGLATYSTQSRIKEIGIRRINGATIKDILVKFNSELLRWIMIAYLVAIPAAYYVMTEWLGNFAYKAGIGAGIFILSGLLTAAIGIFTVTAASSRAAATNPSDIIRIN